VSIFGDVTKVEQIMKAVRFNMPTILGYQECAILLKNEDSKNFLKNSD